MSLKASISVICLKAFLYEYQVLLCKIGELVNCGCLVAKSCPILTPWTVAYQAVFHGFLE